MAENYSFKILREKVADEDGLETKTHQSIADSLIQIIKQESEEGGLTIGLEGAYGSGKSTIINLFKKKIDKDKYHVFYFDSWQHEGDPLRRSFLEGFIDSIDIKGEKIEDLRKRVSKRLVTKKVTTTRSTSWLAIFTLISAFITPFGFWLLNRINSTELTLCIGCEVHWIGLFAVFLAGMPILILLVWGLKIMIQNKSLKAIKDLTKWPLIQDGATVDTTFENSEEEERTSVEFERYFKEALGFTVGKRAILIIDNLDRVQPDVGLRIIATLQTFIQHRNTDEKEWAKDIWTIIPYDGKGLSSIWHSPESGASNKASSAFLNKLFQITIEVPNMVIDSWQKFLASSIEEAFSEWDRKEKELIIALFKATRKELLDIPEPRDIKIFINQVGLHRIQCDEEISLPAIVIFCIQRYVEKESKTTVKENLINRHWQLEPQIDILIEESVKKNLVDQIASIVYKVPVQDALIMLLQPEIRKCLIERNSDRLSQIHRAHKNHFDFICDRILRNSTPTVDYLDCLLKLKGFRIKSHIIRFQQTVSQNTFNLPTDEIAKEAYINVLQNVKNETVDFVLEKLLSQIKSQFSEGIIDYQGLSLINQIMEEVEGHYSIAPAEIKMSLPRALDLVAEGKVQKLGLYKVFRFSQTIFDEFSSKIETQNVQEFNISHLNLVKEFHKHDFPIEHLLDSLVKYRLEVNSKIKINESLFLMLIYVSYQKKYLMDKTLAVINTIYPQSKDINFGQYTLTNINLNLFAELFLFPEKSKSGLTPFWRNPNKETILFTKEVIILTGIDEFLWIIAKSRDKNLAHSVLLSCLESGIEILSLSKETPLSRLVTIINTINLFEKDDEKINKLDSLLRINEVKSSLLRKQNLRNLKIETLTFLHRANNLTEMQKKRITDNSIGK